MRTLDQRQADALLDQAIKAVRTAYDLIPDHALLIDYVVVIEGRDFDDDGESDGEFVALAFREGECRKSAALGLLWQGHDLLAHGERVE